MWSIDASFALHKEMRGRIVMSLNIGIGSLISLYLKQKINTESSTEAELV